MIIDAYENLTFYESMHSRFPAAFAFMRELMEKGVEDGKYVLPGTDVENAISISFATGPLKVLPEAIAESHKKYIDVQIVLKGEEMMYVPAITAPAAATEYNESKDVIKYDAVPFDACHGLRVSEGNFVIFFENELHAPSMSVTNEVTTDRKAVIKVLAK